MIFNYLFLFLVFFIGGITGITLFVLIAMYQSKVYLKKEPSKEYWKRYT